MTSKNQITTWDFTLKRDGTLEPLEIKKWLRDNCKTWCFQIEEGKGKEYIKEKMKYYKNEDEIEDPELVEIWGYIHYQGRVSFPKKTRNVIGLLHKICHWSPTSLVNFKNKFYAMKEDTRISGPWMDIDTEMEIDFIPNHVSEIKALRPFQNTIINRKAAPWNCRKLDFVYGRKGNDGKSTVASYAFAMKKGMYIPPLFDTAEKIMQFIHGQGRHPLYVCDLPRALSKKNNSFLYAALECLKDGWLFDGRNKGRLNQQDRPNIWVFSNKLPNLNLLSSDRWNFWKIDEFSELVDITEKVNEEFYKEDPYDNGIKKKCSEYMFDNED